MCREVSQPAIQLRSQLYNKYMGYGMREYFFTYVVEYYALTRTEYAKKIIIVISGVLAYLMQISGNSGVQKRMAI